MADDRPLSLLAMTAEIVAAHVSNNSIAPAELPKLITDVFRSLSDTDAGRPPGKLPEPAVAIKKSVAPDHIVCLEDGYKFKSMKRHLKTSHGITPDEYRQKWNLASDYPMVAPNYAKHRSSLAKNLGLGTKRASRKRKSGH